MKRLTDRQFIFRLWLSMPYSTIHSWNEFYKTIKKEMKDAELNKINS